MPKSMTPCHEWRLRRRPEGWLEAVCRHGTGHSLGIHGCDRCCTREDFPEGQLFQDERVCKSPGRETEAERRRRIAAALKRLKRFAKETPSGQSSEESFGKCATATRK